MKIFSNTQMQKGYGKPPPSRYFYAALPIQNESSLVYDIMRELGKHGAVFRTNAGNIRLPNGKTFHGLPKGFSDVLFIGGDGIACFVEAKIKPNKPDSEQLKFIEKMRGMGCRAGVAYSVDEAVYIFEIK